jgi:hypothetical protein
MSIIKRSLLLIFCLLSLMAFPHCSIGQPVTPASIQINNPANSTNGTSVNTLDLIFSSTGHTNQGDWFASAAVSPSYWQPGTQVTVNTTLTVNQLHLLNLTNNGYKADGFCLLLTAERTFDSDGILRLSSDEKMSTLVTPTGLAIEGGVQGAVTNRFGYGFKTPVDEFQTLPITKVQNNSGQYQAAFNIQTKLPPDLPPGIYRVRLDYGITIKNRFYDLNCDPFAKRPFFQGQPTESQMYSPPIPASGNNVNGKLINASTIKPRIPWVILSQYNSNGYSGVVADEDMSNFALSNRNIIPDDVILPLYDDYSNKLSYNLEPQFPTDSIELRCNIPWDYSRGELSIQVVNPDGSVTDLGTAPITAKSGFGVTTKSRSFISWKPPSYGYYSVKATGWIYDIWGNRYTGGGTYHFWIAKRMTMATATFQGMSYPVGNRYGRDIGFAPAVPADVEVTATLYVNSDPNNKRSVSYKGKASPGGIFGAAQGSQPLPLDSTGEYCAHVLAKYSDVEGHLWVCSMHHAGVVYSDNSTIIAHGKKLVIDGKYVDRGDTRDEGFNNTANNLKHLVHINFPYQSGDVLLTASDGQGANKIEPVLTYEDINKPQPWDSQLNTIGATNLRLATSNGYSPHMFPEYITDWMYYYAGAPRPGFMGRFLVGEDGIRAPYWPTSPNSFGNQINASPNGDTPGDIYRLIGGVVVRKKGQQPQYAGYLSSGFILPKGTKNDRIVAAGSEDLPGPNGQSARLFLVGLRPGMLYETGTLFTPAVQIDPVLPATIKFSLVYPDGRNVAIEGTGDKFGSFAGKDKWTLDIPGIYKYRLEGEWQGYKGYMPGLSTNEGEFYVIEKDRPANSPTLKLNLSEETIFSPVNGFTINGYSSAPNVYYAAVIPGAVIGEGTIPVVNGVFRYHFNPMDINRITPTYDIENINNGKPDIKDVIHLTFFSREAAANGNYYYSFTRLIIRGNKILYVR